MSAKNQFHFERETEALHSRGQAPGYNPDDELLSLVIELTEHIKADMVGVPVSEVGEAHARETVDLVSRAKAAIKKHQ